MTGCLGAGLLPFAAGAAACLAFAGLRLARGDFEGGLALGAGAFTLGLVPAAVVFALYLMRAQAGAARLAQRRRESHPTRPWLWREDWAESRSVHEVPRVARVVVWAFALVWNGALAVFWLAALLGGTDDAGDRLVVGGALLLFQAAGLFLFWKAVQESRNHRRFGRSVFELGQVPFAPGDRVYGFVRGPALLRTARSFEARLACVRTVSSGSRGAESTRWQDERVLDAGEVRAEGEAVLVPVSMDLPPDQASTRSEGEDPIAWRLTLRAHTRGGAYEAVFDVPVFPRE